MENFWREILINIENLAQNINFLLIKKLTRSAFVELFGEVCPLRYS